MTSAADAFRGIGDAITNDRYPDLPAGGRFVLRAGEARVFTARSKAAGVCFLLEVVIVESDHPQAKVGRTHKIMVSGLDGEHRDLKLGNVKRIVNAIANTNVPDEEFHEVSTHMVDDQAFEGELFRCETGEAQETMNGKGHFIPHLYRPYVKGE